MVLLGGAKRGDQRHLLPSSACGERADADVVRVCAATSSQSQACAADSFSRAARTAPGVRLCGGARGRKPPSPVKSERRVVDPLRRRPGVRARGRAEARNASAPLEACFADFATPTQGFAGAFSLEGRRSHGGCLVVRACNEARVSGTRSSPRTHTQHTHRGRTLCFRRA